ncbi:MAG: hypothetical protein FWE48_00010 [Coriobacteriia bacterium]|nr:hypothetical protein [Coriobacteriia bacterium]MCL2745472.1 hypothetical protein [Coriobacteriia bacterium]MCL2871215.1 hypothetical protein [Coriobacteriia bacterium]
MSRELIFKNDEIKAVFEKAVAEFGVDETVLYEPRIIRQICQSLGIRYLFIQEFGEKLTFYVPFGLAEIKNYKPALKVKKSLANDQKFRDLSLPMSMEARTSLINQMIMEANDDGVEVIVRVKQLYRAL